MNKIYKVVWSKVKNCYVVVSEIAKNVITGGVKSAKVGKAPLANGLALGALMAFVITGNVWASPTIIDASQYKDNTITFDVDAMEGEEVRIIGKNIIVSGDYNGLGAWTEYYPIEEKGIIVAGDSDTDSITIKDATYGIIAYGDGAEITVNADTLTIQDCYAGIWGANRSDSTGDNFEWNEDKSGLITEDDAKVIINAGTTIIKDCDAAIVAQSQGTVEINGNLYATGVSEVIDVRGESVTNINKTNDENITVQLKGNIVFDPGSGKNQLVDSKVNVNLANDASWFEGLIRNDAPTDLPDDKDKVTGMKLGLSNGAQWKVTGDSFVNSLAGDGGKLVKATEEKVTVTVLGEGSIPDRYNIYEKVTVEGKDAVAGSAVTNKNLTVEGVDLVIDTEKTAIYNQDLKLVSDSDVIIKSKEQGIAAYGEVEIEAKNVTIESVDNGIQSVADKNPNDVGNVTIKAVAVPNDEESGKVLIKATTEGYAVTNVSTNNGVINVYGKDVTLISENRTAVKTGHEVGTEGYNGTINIGDEATQTITIQGAAQNPADKNERKGSAVYAQAGTINLSATDTITITDTAKKGGNAIGAYGGVVNVQDAANVVIDGKVYATGEGSQVNITTTGDVAVNDAGVSMSSSEEDALAFATNKGAIAITGNKENTITLTGGGGDWDNGKSQAIAAAYGGTSTVKDFKEVVFAGEHAHSGFYAFAGGTTVVENIGTIKQNEDSSIGQAFNAFGGNLTVKADVIELDNVGNGIFAQTAGANNGDIRVEAKTIDIKGNGGLIAAMKMNAGEGTTKVYVEADDITLVANENNAGVNVNNSYYDGKTTTLFNDSNTVDIIAHNKLSVTGSNAVNANHGVKDGFVTVNITAKEMEIFNNGINNAVRANDYAQINVNASEKLTISGEVESTNNSEININANTAFDAEVTSFNADNTSKINLTGGDMSGTLNILEGTKVHLTGATFTAEKLDDAVDGGGVLVLDGSGVLKTVASEVFENSDTTATKDFNNEVIVNNEVVYKAGAISLAEDYSYEYLSDALNVMKAHEYEAEKTSATKIIMTGNLKTSVEDIGGEDNTITADQASGLGNGVELDKVTVEAEENLLIGGSASEANPVTADGVTAKDSVANGFSANELDLGDADGAIVTGGQELTLGGSEGSDNLVSSDTGSARIVIGAEVAGVSDSTAVVNIGNTSATEDTEYTLNGSVKVNEGSELNTKGQTEITEGVELDGGIINVKSGQLNADITASGESTITGSVSGELTGSEGAVLNIGTADKTASTSFSNVDLVGATVTFDPDWNQAAGQHGLQFANDTIASNYKVVRNNYVAFGTDDTNAAKTMFEKTGLAFGENDINAAIYIKGNQVLAATGSIYVDGNQATGSAINAVAGTFSAAANSITMVDANTGNAALSGVVTANIDDAAKLYIDEAADGQTYKVLAGVDNGWQDANILTNNQLIKFTGDAQQDGAFNVTADLQDVSEVYGSDVIIADVVDKAVSSDTPATDFFNSTVNDKVNASKEAQVSAMNSAGSFNELAGVSHTTYAVSNILADAVADHMSLAISKEHDKDIWAHYVHTKENIEGLQGAGEYDAQYNGIVVGADLYKEGKATVGAALTYVDGNINGSTLAARTENDAKYYGASIYGSIENKDTAVIADVSYLHGEHDITQRNSGATITGEPESDAFSVGVRVEQSTKAGIGKLVPYAGLRYMHLGTGNYTNSIGLAYDADDAELFLLPVGLKYSSEVKNTNGWTVRPVVELGYVWAFGDTDTNQTVSLNGASNGFGYDVTDSGSYVGRFVLEAEKANISYALGYEYQKGDDVKADKWMVNVNWKF